MEQQLSDILQGRALKEYRPYYYHVTRLENIDSIKREGIKANKYGLIFCLTNTIVAGEVAENQCFIRDEFAIFMILTRGITGNVLRDRVAEFSAPAHRIIVQKKISPKDLYFMGIDKVRHPSDMDLFFLDQANGVSMEQAVRNYNARRAASSTLQKCTWR